MYQTKGQMSTFQAEFPLSCCSLAGFLGPLGNPAKFLAEYGLGSGFRYFLG
jgi:hypothetical protein